MTKREDAKAATRAKAIAAARTLFERDGYEAATIRDMAKEMGMSTGAIFANFSGKEEIYRAVYGHSPIGPDLAREMMLRLETAAATFREYQTLHEAKGTVDGTQKAATNAGHAHAIERLLAQVVRVPPPAEEPQAEPEAKAA